MLFGIWLPRNISSVIVIDHVKQPVGILTERDIMKRVIANDCVDLDSTPISQAMTFDPITLHPDNTIYRALSVLTDSKVKHLPLIEDGKIVGIVTMRQLLKLRYPEPLTLIEGIREAGDVATLKAIKNKLPKMAEERLGIRQNSLRHSCYDLPYQPGYTPAGP